MIPEQSIGCLILASDGVWDTITPAECVKICQNAKGRNLTEKARDGIRDIIRTAEYNWNKMRIRADNITAIVMMYSKGFHK